MAQAALGACEDEAKLGDHRANALEYHKYRPINTLYFQVCAG